MSEANTRKTKREQSVPEVSETFGVHVQTVREWIAAGCPATKQKKSGRYKVDETEIAAWLKSNNLTGKPGRPKDGGGGDSSFEKIRERKELAMAENWEIRNAQLRGELLPADEVKAKMVQHIREARAGLEGLGAAIAPALVGMPAGPIQVKIDERISDILRRLSGGEVATD